MTVVASLLSLLLTLPGAGPAAEAVGAAAADRLPAVRSWHIEEFHADVRVQTTGRVLVTEHIRVRFDGSYNGIYRDIPIEYRQAMGFNYTLRLTDIEVTDAAGTHLRFETSRERHYRRIKVWVPDARDAARTVNISYTVENGLRWFEEDDRAWTEFYWNVTGDEWPVPIDAASARIVLPRTATGVRARAFTGAFRSTASDAEIELDGPVIDVATLGVLGIREGLTVTVALDTRVNGDPDGAYVIAPPTTADEAVAWLRSNWPIFFPFLLFFLMYRIWARYGRDPKRLPVTTRYEPPEGLTVSEAGALIDNRVDMRDVTSMIVDLAVRGHLKIRKEEGTKLLGISVTGDTFEFERMTDRKAWDGLAAHEIRLLNSLFDDGAKQLVSTSDLKNRFYKDLPGIKEAVWNAMIEHGMYRSRPDHVQAVWLVIAAVVGLGGAFLGAGLASATGMSTVTTVTAAVLSGLIIAAFGVVMPARTRQGARAQEEALGFEDFLDHVESDRYRRMITGPEMFERYLPYAMAFGVEDNWASAFAEIYRDQPAPAWYSGSGSPQFHARSFTSDMSRMATSTAAVMQSAPRSSGGSGFSGGGGGGFSGGGGGGGGGGAF